MARRLSILSVLLATYAVVSLSCASIGWGKTISASDAAGLNRIINGDASIEANDIVDFIVNLPSTGLPRYIQTETVTINGGAGQPAYTLNIRKRGAGLWRWNNGDNVMSAASLNFTVEAGTLELMNNTTVSLTGSTATSFQLNDGTRLNARGNNKITAPVTIGSNVTLGIDLTNLNVANPILDIVGNVATDPAPSGTIDLLGFARQEYGSGVTQNLIRYNYAGTAPADGPAYPMPPIVAVTKDGYTPNFEVKVRGEDFETVKLASNGRLKGTIDQTTAAGTGGFTSTITIKDLVANVGQVTWTGNANSDWNATTRNWTEAGPTFLHGDTVTFDGRGAGTINVNAGGVQIGADYTPQDNSKVYGMHVTDGTYTFINDADSLIGIDGAGSVYIQGDADVTFASANSYWGGTAVVGNASLTLNHIGGLGTGNLTLNDNATFVLDITGNPVNGNEHILYNNIIGSGGTIVKEGDNTVRIVGSAGNSSSDTEVNEGILQNNIGKGVLTVEDGAEYHAYGANRTIAGLKGSGKVDLNNYANPASTDPLTLTINVTQGTPEFSGQIVGVNGRIIKTGTREQVFIQNVDDITIKNTYTGGTAIHEGTLTGRIELDDKSYNIDVFGTGTIETFVGGSLKFEVSLRDLDDAEIYFATNQNKITGTGNVIKTGPGILFLGATNPTNSNGEAIAVTSFDPQSDYTGITDVQEGTLRIGHVNAVGKTSEIILRPADTDSNESTMAGKLQFGGFDDPITIGSETDVFAPPITGKGSVDILKNTTLWMAGYNAADTSENAKESTYSGITTVYENSQLILTDPRGTGKTAQVVLADDSSVLTLHFVSKKDADDEEVEQLYDRQITGLGSLTKEGAGIAVLDNAATGKTNDYQGTTTIEDGVLKITYATATGSADNHAQREQSVEIKQGAVLELALTGTGSYEKGIKGEGALAHSGTGRTELNGYSSYTGGTYLYGGTLSFKTNNDQPGNLGSGGIYFQRGGGILQNRELVTDLKQDVVIDAGSTGTFDTKANLTIGSNYSISNGTNELVGAVSDFIKTGSATMTINGVASWTGETTVMQGKLVNNIPEMTALTVYTAAEYATGVANRNIIGLYGETDTTGGVVTLSENTSLNIHYSDTENADIFAGKLTGKGNLILTGEPLSGASEDHLALLELTGTNDYTGTTTVTGSFGAIRGNIAENTRLIVDLNNYYFAGTENRKIESLQGGGIVDMEGRDLQLTLNVTDYKPNFSGSIRNGKNLVKTGIGTQLFSGGKFDFSANVHVKEGQLTIGGDRSSFSRMTVGQNLTVDDGATIGIGKLGLIEVTNTFDLKGTLDVVAGSGQISAQTVLIDDDAILNLTGLGEEDGFSILIQSTRDEIVNNFKTENVYIGGSVAPSVDYLSLGVEKSEDNMAILIGQTLSWYATDGAHGNFTIENPTGSFTLNRVLENVDGNNNWSGRTLVKKGPGELVLTAENTYTGETWVKGGTLTLANEKATGGSSGIILDGGTLNLNFNSKTENNSWTAGMQTNISGTGTMVKSGYDTAVYNGSASFTGMTHVKQGALLVDGSIASQVLVATTAGFGGNGVVRNDVTMADGSYYLWRFGETEAQSDRLVVTGNMTIGNQVVFRPITSSLTRSTFDGAAGWTIIEYDKNLNGSFVSVDDSESPFYQFELDYDEQGKVKVAGNLRETPLALSDVVSASVDMAQTKMYRTAFRQIVREWNADAPLGWQVQANQNALGQAPQVYRTAWANFVGRGDHYKSSYHNDNYSLQSYGVQCGTSLLSSANHTFGILFGREEGKLSNDFDRMDKEDYYLGLYYGRLFANNVDFMAYVGGGWQKYDLIRQTADRRYGADMSGSTFNVNVQLGKRFLASSGFVIRPYVGVDVEYTRIGAGDESVLDGKISQEYRNYGGTHLARVFLKLGVETQYSWNRFDMHAGMDLNANAGDHEPATEIYYPVLGRSVKGYGKKLGQFDLGMNVGMNWYLTSKRSAAFFLDFDADWHVDRPGDFLAGTGTLGFFWRF